MTDNKISTNPTPPKKSAPRNIDWLQSGRVCTYHEYLVPEGHDTADVLNPEYFSNATSVLKKCDRIAYCNADATVAGTLIVEGVSGTEVHVRELGAKAETEGSSQMSGAIIDMIPGKGWRIVDASTGDVIRDGFDKKVMAVEWFNQQRSAA